jgi:hypothetical protein
MTAAAEPLFLIVDPDWEVPTEVCSGPDSTGACALAVPGRPVPCAGRDLLLLNSDLSARWARTVGAYEDECPVPILVAGGG